MWSVILAQIGDEQAYQYLQDIGSEDQDPEVREAAREALLQKSDIEELIYGLLDSSAWIQVKPLILSKGTEIIPSLIPLMEHPTHIQRRVIGIIVEMGEEALQFLKQMKFIENHRFPEYIDYIISILESETE
jgi:hypothetical protein